MMQLKVKTILVKPLRMYAVLALCAFLSACSAMQGIGTAAGVIGSDTPSVDATAQVGAENVQEGDAVVDTRRAEDWRVDASVESGVSNVTQQESGVSNGDWTAEEILVQQVPVWLVLLLALGFLLPSFKETMRWIGKGIMFIRDVIKGER